MDPSDSHRRPTLRDVAILAGVSHMTVSRVIRGERSVSGETEARVKNAVTKLGYRPDPRLTALAAYRSNLVRADAGSTLAFLDCDGTAYSGRVLAGVRAEAGRLGYAVVRHRLACDEKSQRALGRELFHRGVQGLLFGPSDAPLRFSGWDWDAFAPVSLGALHHEPPMHAVGMDYFDGLLVAFDNLQRSGSKKIGLVIEEDLEKRTGHLWKAAYLAATEWPEGVHFFKPGKLSIQQIQRWARKLCLDGILTIHPQIEPALSKMGIRVAYLNDVGVRDGSGQISFDPQEIGVEGVRLLHHLLLRGELGLSARPKTVLLRGEWEVLDHRETGKSPGKGRSRFVQKK